MTFKVYGEIEIDGKAARVEIKGVDDALEKAARGADKFSFSGKGAANSANQLKGETTLAAGSVANLGAQFNDIGVMLAAGQNPLQLAIQQGTQITQVFGNAGAAARVNMLKQAFLSVISPANLLTIGIIAGGAALAQWGMNALSAGENTDDLAEKIEAVRDKISGLRDEVRGLELGLSEEELVLVDAIAASRERVAGLQEEANAADVEAVLFVNQRLDAERENLSTLEQQLRELRDYSDKQREIIAQKKAENTAREELADLRAKAQITRLITQYGEDSRRVTVARVQAERDAFLETKLTEGISADLVVQLMRAWDNAKGVASVDMAGNITLAADEAGRLMQNLFVASRIGLSADLADEDAAMSQNVIPTASDRAGQRGAIDNFKKLIAPKKKGGGGGRSAASEAEREREAVDDLIQSLQQQLDIVRETDPVQKEMIRNRETLKAATDAEKQSVEQLIASRIAEEAAIERATENAEAFKDISWQALEGVLFRSESASDAVANLADMLAQAAAQAAFLGTGPLANLFGTADSGGLLGIIGTALFPGSAPGQADGGIQYGAGGPRDDLLPRWISPGEFIVNAEATSQNRALLEYINGGGLMGGQGFAAGGMPIPVPMPNSQGGGGAQSGRVVISLAPSPLFDARVVEASQGVFVEGMEQYRAQGLPQDVERISLDPGRRG